MRLMVAALLLFTGACDMQVKCDRCDGRGRSVCTMCTMGKVNCPGCSGRGEVTGSKCRMCQGGGTNACSGCKGKGGIECPRCNGKGK